MYYCKWKPSLWPWLAPGRQTREVQRCENPSKASRMSHWSLPKCALTSASKILLKALAMAASIPTMSNSMLSSPVFTTSIRKFWKAKRTISSPLPGRRDFFQTAVGPATKAELQKRVQSSWSQSETLHQAADGLDGSLQYHGNFSKSSVVNSSQ